MELKDILGFTGIEAESVDDFKAKFSETFVPKSEYSKLEKEKSDLVGQTLGPVQTKIKSVFGLSAEETKGFTKWEEYLSLAETKVKAKETELHELSFKGSDTALKELNEKLDKSNKSVLEYKTAVQQAQEELQKEREQFAGKFKTYKAESVFKDSFLKVQPNLASLSEPEQFYLNAQIKENVFIDFDENDQPIVLNKEGKRWADPNKAGGFLTADQAIFAIATEKNLIKKNDAGERKPIFGNNNAGGGQQNNTDIKPHPNTTKYKA